MEVMFLHSYSSKHTTGVKSSFNEALRKWSVRLNEEQGDDGGSGSDCLESVPEDRNPSRPGVFCGVLCSAGI